MISIITISYNQNAYLEQAILSVTTQAKVPLQYIVVDAQSTDGSLDIIRNHRKSISDLVVGKDEGPADGLNRGLSLVKGEIFGYLNADDYLLPGSLSEVVESFANTDADAISGNGYLVNEIKETCQRFVSARFNKRRFALGACPVLQQSTFFRSALIDEGFRFNVLNKTCWDSEFLYSIGTHGKSIRHINKYWSCFRIHGSSITGSQSQGGRYASDQERYLGPEYLRYGRALPVAQKWARIEKVLVQPSIAVAMLADKFAPITRPRVVGR